MPYALMTTFGKTSLNSSIIQMKAMTTEQSFLSCDAVYYD